MTDSRWHDAYASFLAMTQYAQPDQIAECADAALRPLGLRLICYLVDHEQRHLHALVPDSATPPQSLSVDGTAAGRAFTTVITQSADDHLWIPLIDGSERLGVVKILVHDEGAEPALQRRECETFTNLVGHLIATKLPYGDHLHRVRRTRIMPAASELLLGMLPPLTFSCHQLVVSAILEPHYDVGGDAFDYAVDGTRARFMVLDAMGRGLSAGITVVTAIAAIRSARRADGDLTAMAESAHAALTDQFGNDRFVTGVLADLDLESGRLRYLNAGHPRPLLMRNGKVVAELASGRRLPLGIDDDRHDIGERSLEPGDRLLLYTDGVVEARDPEGGIFGVERLIDLAEKAATSQLPAPETLRRLSHEVSAHQAGPPSDDATMMLVEWSALAKRETAP